MLNSDLTPPRNPSSKPVVSAVSYLNTTPLIWGLQHTQPGGSIRLEFALPSECADHVRDGVADVGILPVIEIDRQGLDWLPGVGICCRGPVRSILLVSRTPLSKVSSLAADIGSRTSVTLARIILAERYGVEPGVFSHRAELAGMLQQADAALIIGDPALRLDPVQLRRDYEVLDLGEEWVKLTGLPMIFALWSGRPDRLDRSWEALFADSCRYGLAHLDEIVAHECPPRNIPEALGREYLTSHIAFELNERDYEGMRTYLQTARQLANLEVSRTVPA